MNRCPAEVPAEVAARQWAEWRATRRHLLQIGAFGGLGIGLGRLGRHALLSPQGVAAQESPKSGGSIRMSLADADVRSFDPFPVFDNMSIWTMLLIYDQLIRVGPDGQSLEPGLAESWQVSQDGLTYTFKLRQTAFHDGTPCTSADVVYCLNRTIFTEGSPWAFIFSAVDSVEGPDPQTVVIRLKSIWVPFEADLALFAASIYPKAAYEAQGDELWQHPIGTGPFMFDSWEKDVQVVLKKNPNYWDPPKPYLDELVFKALPDSNARMLQFQGGDLDIVTQVPFSQLDALRSNPDVTVLDEAVARIDYIGLNLRRPPLDDKKLRQAMNYAIDKEALIKNVLFGAGEPATSYLPKMPGRDPNSPGYPHDLEKAKQLVAESSAKDGFALELLISAGDAVGSQVAQLVASNLAEIGGKITITSLEPATVTDRITVSQDFDMYLSYYTTDIIDPDELTSFAVLSDGGTQAVWTGYKNEQVDALIRQSQTETDPEKRQELYNQIQRLVLDDAHLIYLYYPTGTTAIYNYVKNFRILPTGNYRLYESWRDDVS